MGEGNLSLVFFDENDYSAHCYLSGRPFVRMGDRLCLNGQCTSYDNYRANGSYSGTSGNQVPEGFN